MNTHPRFRKTAGLTALLVAVIATPLALAFPPAKPYDPRPLMPAVEKRMTGNKYSFIVMGDSKNGGAFPGVVKRAAALKPAFVLLTGDMTQMALPKYYDKLAREIGPLARKVPVWPCPGNHDVGGFYARQFKNYAEFWGIKTRHYTFDFKNARFICLWAHVAQPKRDELKWLETQLADGKKAGKLMFVYQHLPCYTVGRKPPAEIPGRPTAFTKLMTKYGVVANFSGHDHIYYRTRRDKVNYIIQALGGAGIYGGNRRAEAIKGDAYAVSAGGGNMLVHAADGTEKTVPVAYMLTRIDVDGKKVTGKTMTAAGDVIDEFTLSPLPMVPAARANTRK